jgi:hypothetical protein
VKSEWSDFGPSTLQDCSFTNINDTAILTEQKLTINDTVVTNARFGIVSKTDNTIVHGCTFINGSRALEVAKGLVSITDTNFHQFNESVIIAFASSAAANLVVVNVTISDGAYGIMKDTRASTLFPAVLENSRFVNLSQVAVAMGAQTFTFANNNIVNCTSSQTVLALTGQFRHLEFVNNTFVNNTFVEQVCVTFFSSLLFLSLTSYAHPLDC